MSFLAWMSCKKNGYESQRLDLWLWMYILFFTFISAIRWNVGVDSPMYFKGFLYGDVGLNAQEGSERIWSWWVNLIHRSSLSPTIGMGGAALLQIFFLTDALKKYRRLLIVLPFILFGSRYFLDYSNAVRQMIAASIFVWSIQFILSRNIIKYALSIFLASLIHQSALGLIVFFFVPAKLDLAKFRWPLLITLLFCFVIGMTPSFKGAGTVIQSILSYLGYDIYTDRVTLILGTKYSDEALGFGPMMLSYLLISIFIIWYGPILRNRYESLIPAFDIWFLFANIYSCLYFLVCNVSHLFIRPLMYFELFQLIIASLVLLNFINSRYKLSMMALFYYCIVPTNTVWDVWKAQGKKFESATYKTILTYPYKTELHHFR